MATLEESCFLPNNLPLLWDKMDLTAPLSGQKEQYNLRQLQWIFVLYFFTDVQTVLSSYLELKLAKKCDFKMFKCALLI